MICKENPAKCRSLAKNPPKYTTAYIVRQSNCRWHCEPTCLSCLASTMKSLFTPPPLRSVSFLSLPLYPPLSLPLQTLRLVSLVSLIAKTKRIAERSDTNCDTHTHTHTDRQSTLDKYMINKKQTVLICKLRISLCLYGST
jgi:hypothetical protein